MSFYREPATMPVEPVVKTKLVMPPMRWAEKACYICSALHKITALIWVATYCYKDQYTIYLVAAVMSLICSIFQDLAAQKHWKIRRNNATVVNI